jgi:hypothetical protein
MLIGFLDSRQKRAGMTMRYIDHTNQEPVLVLHYNLGHLVTSGDKKMPPSVKQFQQRVANITIGASTLRNQGASGVNQAVRSFLGAIDLAKFVSDKESDFIEQLDYQTNLLAEHLPVGAQHWGTARKAINLFLGEAYYHYFLRTNYGLDRIEQFLEVPLDSQVAHFLIDDARAFGVQLPSWLGIKHLTPSASKEYQNYASSHARSLGQDWARIHLDVIAWRSDTN